MAAAAFAAGGCGALGSAANPTIAEVDAEGALAAYEQGNQRFIEGDYNGAVEAYTRAIALNPGLWKAYNNRAIAYARLDQPELALEDLNRADAGSGGDVEIVFNLGNVHLLRGFFEQAREAFERVLEIRPNDQFAKNNLAVALLRLGELERAEQLLQELLVSNPDNADALANLGTVCDATGDTERAIATYRRTLELDPNHLRTLRNLGFLEAREGLVDDAIGHLERFLALAPSEMNVHRVEGMLQQLLSQR